MLAAMAQESGAAAYAVVVTPWRWELGRYPLAFDAVKKLHRSCDYMVALSNEATGNELGDTATLKDVIKQQELEAGESLQMLLRLGRRSIIRGC
jgi:cell division GTPase FtsZ